VKSLSGQGTPPSAARRVAVSSTGASVAIMGGSAPCGDDIGGTVGAVVAPGVGEAQACERSKRVMNPIKDLFMLGIFLL